MALWVPNINKTKCQRVHDKSSLTGVTRVPAGRTSPVCQYNRGVGHNLWICDIHGSRCAIYGSILCAESMDCAEICGSRRVQSTDLPVIYPDLTIILLLWINIARQVAVCDWWTILEVSLSAWYETHVSNQGSILGKISGNPDGLPRWRIW